MVLYSTPALYPSQFVQVSKNTSSIDLGGVRSSRKKDRECVNCVCKHYTDYWWASWKYTHCCLSPSALQSWMCNLIEILPQTFLSKWLLARGKPIHFPQCLWKLHSWKKKDLSDFPRDVILPACPSSIYSFFCPSPLDSISSSCHFFSICSLHRRKTSSKCCMAWGRSGLVRMATQS